MESSEKPKKRIVASNKPTIKRIIPLPDKKPKDYNYALDPENDKREKRRRKSKKRIERLLNKERAMAGQKRSEKDIKDLLTNIKKTLSDPKSHLCTPFFRELFLDTPEQYYTLTHRVFISGKSNDDAIKMKCLQCRSFSKVDIKHCKSSNCALHRLRPFQNMEESKNQ